MDLEINDLGSIGVIKDVPAYLLPPEAWSDGMNVRFLDNDAERLMGWTRIFGTPLDAPHFAMPVVGASQVFWLYVSLTKASVYTGGAHTNITRQNAGVDVDYTAAETRDWNGTLLGGVPILNNGVDTPQYWPSFNPTTKLADLPNWPANTTAKVIRAYGNFLVGINITKNADNFPHMVKWSHPADPGTIPSSWDHTDTTKDAGENDLSDINAGILMDMLDLGNNMYLYKEGSTWRMRFIGGRFIFAFDQFLSTSGILAPRCVTLTGDGQHHVVATQDDIIVHNGGSVESILDKRQKRALANAIDPVNYVNSFMFTNPQFDEVWLCYPSNGQTHPNRALIWNYKNGRPGVISEADGITFRNAILGQLEVTDQEQWDQGTDTWDDDTGPWSRVLRRRVLACDPNAEKFYQMDSGLTRDGATFLATLQRTGLAVVGRKRSGEPIVDFKNWKSVQRLWPKIAPGSPIRIRVGFQDVVDGGIRWGEYQLFDPTTQNFVDILGSGRAVAVEFGSQDPVHWRLSGYKLEFEVEGQH